MCSALLRSLESETWRISTKGCGESLCFLINDKRGLLLKVREPLVKFGLWNDEPARILVGDNYNFFNEQEHELLYAVARKMYDEGIDNYKKNEEEELKKKILA